MKKLEANDKEILLDSSFPIQNVSNDAFEEDWKNAISGDELVRRVHQHIDELYVEK